MLGVALETDLLADGEAAVCVALVALTVLGSGFAVFLGGRVVNLRQGPGGEVKMPTLWMMLVVGFVAPIGGQIDHLLMGILALTGALAGKAKDGGKNVTPSARELRPLALVFLALTVWWPLAALGLIKVLSAP